METTLPQVRVRDKHQVTLPISIVRHAHIRKNDLLDVGYKNGVITLVVRGTNNKKRNIMEYVGITNGLYGKTATDVDTYIANERDSWDR